MQFANFEAVESHLNSLINYEQTFPLGGSRDRPKLEPTLRAVQRLGLSLSLSNCVHVAGTKGKGSVAAFLEALLSPDYTTLSFTSPHLISVKERVRLNGSEIPDSLWQEAFEEIVPALAEEPAIHLTYFESTWILYLWLARRLGTTVNVVEAGLGGKWDATNVLETSLAVLTPVDYDHTEILGNTLTEIATDKSGIIKPGAQVIVARQPAEALVVYGDAVSADHARAAYFDEDFRWLTESGQRFIYEDEESTVESLTLSVPGLHQRDNASVAIRAARTLFPDLPAKAIRERLFKCAIPGRQQLIPGSLDVLLDVAHNPVSFRALSETLRSQFASRKILAVIGMMREKDALNSLGAIKDLVHDVMLVELKNPRTMSLVNLVKAATNAGMNVRSCPSEEAAFELLHSPGSHNLGLVAGSFYLAGDYLLWRQRAGIA